MQYNYETMGAAQVKRYFPKKEEKKKKKHKQTLEGEDSFGFAKNSAVQNFSSLDVRIVIMLVYFFAREA